LPRFKYCLIALLIYLGKGLAFSRKSDFMNGCSNPFTLSQCHSIGLVAKNHQHPNANGFALMLGFSYFFFFFCLAALLVFLCIFILHTTIRHGVKKEK